MAHRGWGDALKHMGVLMTSGTASGLTDGELIERFADRASAEVAFETLVSRHGPMVRQVCLQVLRHDHDADDAFQAVFLVLARRADSIRNPDLLASWLHGVALRTARLARRRRPPVVAPTESVAPLRSPELELDRVEAGEALHDEIGRLPENQRRAVVLCHLQGLTHEEAAGRLGIPSGTVGVRLMRARERLRSRLTRRGFAPSVALFPLPPAIDGVAERASAAISPLLQGATSGEVPAGVASLADGVLRTMIPLKLKLAVASLLGIGLVATGAWSIARSPIADPVVAEAPPVPRQAPVSAIPPDLAAFQKVYRLGPGQVIKRIPPPFAPWRMVEIEARYPHLRENRERRGHLSTLVYQERNGVLENPLMTFSGSPDPEGPWLINLLESVAGFPAQDVEGPDELMKTPIKADWIVRAGASPEQLVSAFDSILRQDCKLPIRLKIVEKEQDVVVARGRYQFKPIVGGKDTLEIYGATLTPNTGGGGTGDFREFLVWVGRFIEPHRHLIDESEDRPKGQISWHQNFRSPFDDEMTREDRGDEAVLKHLTEQTGLSFAIERRKIPILTVERVE